MRKADGTIDWAASEEEAARMSDDEIRFALQDIRDTIEVQKGMDPIAEGYYYDMAFVLRSEQDKRNRK